MAVQATPSLEYSNTTWVMPDSTSVAVAATVAVFVVMKALSRGAVTFTTGGVLSVLKIVKTALLSSEAAPLALSLAISLTFASWVTMAGTIQANVPVLPRPVAIVEWKAPATHSSRSMPARLASVILAGFHLMS